MVGSGNIVDNIFDIDSFNSPCIQLFSWNLDESQIKDFENVCEKLDAQLTLRKFDDDYILILSAQTMQICINARNLIAEIAYFKSKYYLDVIQKRGIELSVEVNPREYLRLMRDRKLQEMRVIVQISRQFEGSLQIVSRHEELQKTLLLVQDVIENCKILSFELPSDQHMNIINNDDILNMLVKYQIVISFLQNDMIQVEVDGTYSDQISKLLQSIAMGTIVTGTVSSIQCYLNNIVDNPMSPKSKKLNKNESEYDFNFSNIKKNDLSPEESQIITKSTNYIAEKHKIFDNNMKNQKADSNYNLQSNKDLILQHGVDYNLQLNKDCKQLQQQDIQQPVNFIDQQNGQQENINYSTAQQHSVVNYKQFQQQHINANQQWFLTNFNGTNDIIYYNEQQPVNFYQSILAPSHLNQSMEQNKLPSAIHQPTQPVSSKAIENYVSMAHEIIQQYDDTTKQHINSSINQSMNQSIDCQSRGPSVVQQPSIQTNLSKELDKYGGLNTCFYQHINDAQGQKEDEVQLQIMLRCRFNNRLKTSQANELQKLGKELKLQLSLQHPIILTVRGEKSIVEAEKLRLVDMVEGLLQVVTVEFDLAHSLHSRLIGVKGRVVQSLMTKYSVEIKFADRRSENPDLVRISGQAGDIEMCKQCILDTLNMTIEEFEAYQEKRCLLKSIIARSKSKIEHSQISLPPGIISPVISKSISPSNYQISPGIQAISNPILNHQNVGKQAKLSSNSPMVSPAVLIEVGGQRYVTVLPGTIPMTAQNVKNMVMVPQTGGIISHNDNNSGKKVDKISEGCDSCKNHSCSNVAGNDYKLVSDQNMAAIYKQSDDRSVEICDNQQPLINCGINNMLPILKENHLNALSSPQQTLPSNQYNPLAVSQVPESRNYQNVQYVSVLCSPQQLMQLSPQRSRNEQANVASPQARFNQPPPIQQLLQQPNNSQMTSPHKFGYQDKCSSEMTNLFLPNYEQVSVKQQHSSNNANFVRMMSMSPQQQTTQQQQHQQVYATNGLMYVNHPQQQLNQQQLFTLNNDNLLQVSPQQIFATTNGHFQQQVDQPPILQQLFAMNVQMLPSLVALTGQPNKPQNSDVEAQLSEPTSQQHLKQFVARDQPMDSNNERMNDESYIKSVQFNHMSPHHVTSPHSCITLDFKFKSN